MTKYLPGLIALVLLIILALQWVGWPPSVSVSTPGAGTHEAIAPASQPQPDLLSKLDTQDVKENYVSMLEHPLFRPDRKPEPTEEEQADQGAGLEENADLKQLDLSAVLITPTVVSAWVRDPATPKLRRLRIGDDYKGWSVQQILEDRVLLERQGEQDALILRDYTKMPPSAPPNNQPRRALRAPVRHAPPKK